MTQGRRRLSQRKTLQSISPVNKNDNEIVLEQPANYRGRKQTMPVTKYSGRP